jgi:hypothetical protein
MSLLVAEPIGRETQDSGSLKLVPERNVQGPIILV